ncbi:MAG: hypothetical protein RMJ56_13045 [Gemmataceae bacterium]|nr:hypothetical protein [Gemmata sp.]MDW8198522.1 hypothetical protein [Gemmataceae bacterium]
MLIWKAHSRKIDVLAFSPCGRLLALGGPNLACRLLDPLTGQRLWTVRTRCDFARSLGFAPDGAVLCRGNGLSVRSAHDGRELRRCGQWCRVFAWNRDGRTAFLADVKAGDVIRRYDLKTGKLRGQIALNSGPINRIAVSPDCQWLATVGYRRFNLVRLRAERFEVAATVAQRAFSSGVSALAFSPCGSSVVWTAGRTLFVWDVRRGRELKRLPLDANKPFSDVAFTPDGQQLITVGKDGITRIWNTRSWQCERWYGWKLGPLCAVAVAADGRLAAVGGERGSIVVWDLDRS